MTILLIDADIPCYKLGFANEEDIIFGEDSIIYSDFEALKRKMQAHIEILIEKTGSNKAFLAISDKDNFRKKVDKSYKGHRKDVRKPTHLAEIQEFLIDTYTVVRRPNIEADDVIGILATHPDFNPGEEKIICSIDKDLNQIAGKHYNPDKDLHYEITDEEALALFYTQIVCGDTADGYKGCKGIGKGKAAKLFEDCETDAEYWKITLDIFLKKEYTEDEVLVQARLARILQYKDYDYDKKEPILWQPPILK